MSITYDEIMIKFVEGGIVKNLAWVVKNLEIDPEVLANASREKVALKKFLTDIQDQFDEFMKDADDDPRNNQEDTDIFGDDDIAVSPNGGGTGVAFMEPPAQGEDVPEEEIDEEEEDDDESFDSGNEFDDGFPKD